MCRSASQKISFVVGLHREASQTFAAPFQSRLRFCHSGRPDLFIARAGHVWLTSAHHVWSISAELASFMGSLVYVASFFGTITRLVLRSREVSSADSHGAIQGSSARALIGDRLLSVPFCARIFRFRSFHLFNNVDERRHFDVVNEVRIRPPTSRLRVDFPDNASIPLALRVIGMSGGDFSIRTNLEKLGLAERLRH